MSLIFLLVVSILLQQQTICWG